MKNITNSSIVVQWDAVDDFRTTTYIVTWTSERELSNIQSATLKEQSSYTITGLTLDTVYTITVTASNECGQGPEYVTSVLFSSGTYHLHTYHTYHLRYIAFVTVKYVIMIHSIS